jgi:hypothetical protein
MFYSWLLDEGAVPGGPWARNGALPIYATPTDALWLFCEHSHLRSPSIRRFAHF